MLRGGEEGGPAGARATANESKAAADTSFSRLPRFLSFGKHGLTRGFQTSFGIQNPRAPYDPSKERIVEF